ncbi:hypothetical protein [Halalkalibacter lacteus]|uniref:hypothetical protein n=1 Tax=Halalkalibacter lacteus TaxID=3090663 RepID=UPI002FCBCD86
MSNSSMEVIKELFLLNWVTVMFLSFQLFDYDLQVIESLASNKQTFSVVIIKCWSDNCDNRTPSNPSYMRF